MTKVSIIVPVYNAEKYLDQCIGHVLEQTDPDWELLLVDDGSKDASAKICDAYAEKDQRIRVIHKPNGGVSSARNAALVEAKGEWLTFVDADDYIEEDFIEKMLEYKDHQLIVGGFKRFGEKNDTVAPEGVRVVKVATDLKEMWNCTIKDFQFWYVWGKMYRTKVIKDNHIEFPVKMRYSEDNCFLLKYMSYIDTFVMISVSGYCHFFENGRGRKFKMSFETFKEHVELQEQHMEYIEKKAGASFFYIRQSVYRRLFNSFLFNLLSVSSFKYYKIELGKFAKYSRFDLLLKETINNKRKVLYFVLFTLPASVGYALRNKIINNIK